MTTPGSTAAAPAEPAMTTPGSTVAAAEPAVAEDGATLIDIGEEMPVLDDLLAGKDELGHGQPHFGDHEKLVGSGTPLHVAEAEESEPLGGDELGHGQPGFGDHADDKLVTLGPTQTVLSHSEKWAVDQYAEAHKLPVSDVTLGNVMDSSEGLLHWASHGKDFGARGPEAQCFKRALAHNLQATNMYADLADPLKLEFRKWWSTQRSWEFTKDTRIITSTFSKSNSDIGEMKTRAQIAVDLGAGVFDKDSDQYKEILRQTDHYMDMARKMGGRFCSQNTWLDAEQVLYVKRLLTTTCTKEWKAVAESSTSVNIWEERAKECRARRNLAAFHGLHIEKVTLEEVQKTPEGVEGLVEGIN
jgi:hypothetical protein